MKANPLIKTFSHEGCSRTHSTGMVDQQVNAFTSDTLVEVVELKPSLVPYTYDGEVCYLCTVVVVYNAL